MYFQKISHDLVLDLDRVWAMTKEHDKKLNLYGISFCLSDSTNIYVNFDDEADRDNVFGAITDMLFALTNMRNEGNKK